MEIKIAKLTLEQAIASPSTMQGSIPALQLALDLLNETFEADFISLETAQKEANDLAVSKNKAEQEKLEALSLKDSEIARITSETETVVEEKEKAIADITSEKEKAEATITEKVSKISVLNEQLSEKQMQLDAIEEVKEVEPVEEVKEVLQEEKI
jgi:chromosome segregation ATPase